MKRYEKILKDAQELEAQHRPDEALDLLYGTFDEDFRSGNFADANQLLKYTRPSSLTDLMIVTLLTVTSPARPLLPDRAEFWKQSCDVLLDRGRDIRKLLYGLKD